MNMNLLCALCILFSMIYSTTQRKVWWLDGNALIVMRQGLTKAFFLLGVTQNWYQKKKERTALDDNHRRSPGSNIDFICKTKQHGKTELALGEISGVCNAHSQELYVGDRSKIAKNQKSMVKYIIGLKSELHEKSANKIRSVWHSCVP